MATTNKIMSFLADEELQWPRGQIKITIVSIPLGQSLMPVLGPYKDSGPCLGTCIKLRLCGMWSSNVFSQIARKTDDLPTPNGSGKKMELTGAADWQIQKPLFLMVKGTEHSFTDADCKGQDQKWALWQSTPFQDTPSFAAWTAVTTHPSLSYIDTVGLGRRS